MIWRNRRALGIALLFALLCTACGDPSAGETPGERSCPAELDFRGDRYVGVLHDGKLVAAERLSDAHFTGCSDGHDQPETDLTGAVPAWSLPGVDPADGFMTKMGGERQLYVNKDATDRCAIKYTRCR